MQVKRELTENEFNPKLFRLEAFVVDSKGSTWFWGGDSWINIFNIEYATHKQMREHCEIQKNANSK